MKKIILNTFLATFLFVGIGCQHKLDENAREFRNAAYMTQANATIQIDRKEGGEAEVEARLASISKKDEVVTLNIDNFLEEYNKENTTNFKMLPASEVEMYEVDNPSNVSKNGQISLTIPQGKIGSKLGIRIKALDSDNYPLGIKYAVPLSISSTSAKSILSNNKTLVALQRQVVTSVAHVKYGHAPKVKFSSEIPETEEFTLQAFFMFDAFHAYTRGVYNMSMLNYHWYSRINPTDVNLADKTKEFSVDGVKIDVRKWYQVTYVRTKDHRVKIYLNGKHIRTFVMPNVKLKGGTTFSIFNPQSSYSVPHILREVRVWDKALTGAQINADLYGPIDPDSDGLVCYLPIDKKNGYNDISKYKNVVELHKATDPNRWGVQDGGQFHKVVSYEEYGIDQWIENVIFPSETLTTVEP